MKRREFLQEMGTGLLTAAIMPDLMGRLLIRQVGRGTRLSTLSAAAYCEGTRIVAIGIGPTAAGITTILSHGTPEISCHQIVFDSTGKGSDLAKLLALVRSCDLLFLLTCLDDPACLPVFEAMGASARECDVFTIGIVPDPAILQPDPKVVSSLWNVSFQALAATPPAGASKTTGWNGYAMRHLPATVVDIILHHSLICVDFADVKSVMTAGSMGRMGVGVAPIESAPLAAIGAFKRLLGQEFRIDTASGFLVCVRSSSAITMDDFDSAAAVIHEWVPSEADFIISLVMDESMGGNVKVTILAVTKK